MPWYDNGTLEQWAGGDKLQEWMQVRSVLLDDLVGLVHLHAHGMIHGDVKPANILVDARERGLLADFDISIHTKNHTSAAHVTRKSTIRAIAQGMTAGFAAPELQSTGTQICLRMARLSAKSALSASPATRPLLRVRKVSFTRRGDRLLPWLAP